MSSIDYTYNAAIDSNYDAVFKANRIHAGVVELQRQVHFNYQPLFSIVVYLHTARPEFIASLLDSVLLQSYENWELIIVNARPDSTRLNEILLKTSNHDSRVRFTSLQDDLGKTESINIGIAACSGDYICFLEENDLLEADALFEYAKAINRDRSADLIYCDEDSISANGKRFCSPQFKPDYDIDLLRSQNYLGHLLCIRKSIIAAIWPIDPAFSAAHDYNLTLLAAEQACKVAHIQRVLYHKRDLNIDDKLLEKTNAAEAHALEAHFARIGTDVTVEPGPLPRTYHAKYAVIDHPLVSIVIPNKDCSKLLTTCIESILKKTSYENYEIIIVDNNSIEPDTFDCYEKLKKQDCRISVITWPEGFNFSAIINFGVNHSQGEYLLLLNNDTEVINPEWLENMLGVCQQNNIGAVGAKLLYSNSTIQHAGVVITDEYTTAHHAYRGAPDSYTGYCNRAALTGQCIAVTGACLMTSRTAFETVGGFDEELAVAFNDIDYCFKLHNKGYRVVYEPTAKLFHYESISRGYDDENIEKKTRLAREGSTLMSRWAQLYIEGDPFYNPHLTSYCFFLNPEWKHVSLR